MSKLTPEYFEREMKKISENFNTEQAHIEADSLMCAVLEALGFKAGIEIFRNMEKWYS